jgi:hypothetical protein
MKRYRYKTIVIASILNTTNAERDAERAADPNHSVWTPTNVNYTKTNPEMIALRNGTYEPPPGWKIISHQLMAYGISLLLEQEIIDSIYR